MNEKNSNTNTNNNNININVDARPKRKYTKKAKEPNWLVKAIVLAIIGLVVTLVTAYIQNSDNSGNKPAVIENGSPAITGHREN